MKSTEYIAALATALAVTSCGTTTQPPKAIPVSESPFGDIISGLRDGKQIFREGGDLLREIRRFREL